MKLSELFFNPFSSKVSDSMVEAVQELQPEPKQKIDSAYIQKELKLSFNELLNQCSIAPSKRLEIKDKEVKLEKFKEDNRELLNKINKLKSLGFVNTPSVKEKLADYYAKRNQVIDEIWSLKKEIIEVERIQELKRKYELEYPTYKFIDDATMYDVMKRYDLVMGDTKLYAKEVPHFALEEMGKFEGQIKEEHLKLDEAILKAQEENGFDRKDPRRPTRQEALENGSSIGILYTLWDEELEERVRSMHRLRTFQMVAPKSHFEIPTGTYKSRIMNHEEIREYPTYILDENNRYVPNIKKTEYVVTEVIVIDDPIACIDVEGGFIILAAWDKEAEIPEIKNESLN